MRIRHRYEVISLAHCAKVLTAICQEDWAGVGSGG